MGNKVIFITDDDPDMIGIYDKVFRMEGFDVDVAYNGQQAMDKLEKAETLPAIFLLDIMMPKVNGFELLTFIKSQDKFKGVPVVFLTNMSSPEDKEKAMSMGADLYLIKSEHDPREVVTKIKTMIK